MSTKKEKKKKPRFATRFSRINIIKEFLVDIFMSFCSWPRLVLEVPLRRNLGKRYFSLFSALTVTFLLGIGPYFTLLDWDYILGIGAGSYGRDYGWGYHHRSLPPFSLRQLYDLYPGWYFLLGLWLGAAVLRRIEIWRNERIFDMERFSYTNGDIYRIFYYPWTLRFSLKQGQLKLGTVKVKFLDRSFTVYVSLVRVYVGSRTVEVFIEPLFGLIAGYFIRIYISETAGYLVQGCSIFYALSSWASYYRGDQFVMDKIDEMIINADMESSFIDDAPINPPSGFRFLGKKPVDKERRRRLLKTIVKDDDDDNVAATSSPPSAAQNEAAKQNGKNEKQVLTTADDEG